MYKPQQQAHNNHKFSQIRGVSNARSDAERPPFTHLRHKKQNNRAWNNHYKANSPSLTSLNQIQSRLAHLGLDSRPYFAQTKTYHTLQEGMNAFFNCKVENIYNQTVNIDCVSNIFNYKTLILFIIIEIPLLFGKTYPLHFLLGFMDTKQRWLYAVYRKNQVH